MNCELCGASGNLLKAIVENSELNVCEKCSGFGKVTGRTINPIQKAEYPKFAQKEEKSLLIVENFGQIIRKKRELLGLSQKDFAKKISEKESIIHKIEVQAIEPNMELTIKLEKLLGIKLIEESQEEQLPLQKQKINELTFGDLVKVRKR